MLWLMISCSVLAETNLVTVTNHTTSYPPVVPRAHPQDAQPALVAERAEQFRTACVEGRRYICGRVLEVSPAGLVVDSGYSTLLNPPFNQSWVVRGNVSVRRDPGSVEEKRPDAVCVGLIFLSDIPKRPAVKTHDYVVMHGYPAGKQTYKPVPGVEKTIRWFSASLDRAVKGKLEGGEK